MGSRPTRDDPRRQRPSAPHETAIGTRAAAGAAHVDAAANADDLRAVRERAPLVHNVTNLVVLQQTANASLAIGASPIMAHAEVELDELVACAGALVLNIGTLAPDVARETAQRLAGRYGCAVVVSGAVDHCIDRTREVLVRNGVAMMARITGMGRTASVLCGAFAAVQ